jgi:hypothetical protein
LAIHVVLGVLCLIVSGLAFAIRFLFAFTPRAVGIVVAAAAMTWALTLPLVVWLWSRQRRAWLASVIWLVVTLTILLTTIFVAPVIDDPSIEFHW